MKVSISLFGAFSSQPAQPPLQLELTDDARIGDLRSALETYVQAHRPDLTAALLRCSAFADSTRVLREDDPLPADGQVALLPPVSGG